MFVLVVAFVPASVCIVRVSNYLQRIRSWRKLFEPASELLTSKGTRDQARGPCGNAEVSRAQRFISLGIAGILLVSSSSYAYTPAPSPGTAKLKPDTLGPQTAPSKSVPNVRKTRAGARSSLGLLLPWLPDARLRVTVLSERLYGAL